MTETNKMITEHLEERMKVNDSNYATGLMSEWAIASGFGLTHTMEEYAEKRLLGLLDWIKEFAKTNKEEVNIILETRALINKISKLQDQK